MKSYILVQLADGTYKNVDTQDIEQIFKNNLGGETVIFKDGWGIKSEKVMVSSSSNPISNKEINDIYKFNPDEILSPDEEVIHEQNKIIERLQEQLNESEKTRHDLELIIKRLKRRSICEKQKAKSRKEHINELIAQVAKQKEEIAKRGRLINELKSQRKEANELLLDFCSEDECLFDHNGYCQEHNSCEGGYKCIQKDLKQYLEKWGVK